jgi:hypothetical protein
LTLTLTLTINTLVSVIFFTLFLADI